MHYTDEDIQTAKNIDLVDLARYMGYTPKRVGQTYTLTEHDSVRIHHRRTYNRYSTGTGGDAIHFVQEFGDLKFPEAVAYCLAYQGVHPEAELVAPVRPEEHPVCEKSMVLPEKADSYKRMFAYLMKHRGLSQDIIQYAVDSQLIYESRDYHNVVFLSKDKEGTVRHAFMRGTNTYLPFKGDLQGNDKRYGFNLPGCTDTLYVYEGAIDALSDLDMDRNFKVSRLALGMLDDRPLATFLQEHPEIRKIHLRMDSDAPGMQAMERIDLKYTALGYEVCRQPPMLPDGKLCKDYNDLLRLQRTTPIKIRTGGPDRMIR